MKESEGSAGAQSAPIGTSAPLGQPIHQGDRPEGAEVSWPIVVDALESAAGDVRGMGQNTLEALALRFPGTPPDVMTESWLRFQARQLIREFLSAVPRSEANTALAFLRPDGTTRMLTRAQLSATIDLLRPRQRQSVRLALEERWPHKQVCDYLNHISLRTLERDLAEALDLLAEL